MTGALERYGVFLRPDPLTCAAITRITAQLRAQFGLISAGAFPPHATLAGSLPLGASAEALGERLGNALAGVPAFTVRNAGPRRFGAMLAYDVHELAAGANPHLIALAARVDAVVRPLLVPAPGLAPDLYAPGRWRAHLSLASHDLDDRPDLSDEVEEYVRGLQVSPPASFAADTVALYRFWHESWTGAWWRALGWEHVRSWRLRRR